MRLTFNSPYLSVSEFEPIDLPTLSVITGVNGAGKSHLLQAIASGNISADDIQTDEIVLFSSETFRLDNQSPFSASQAIQERYNAWAFLTQKGGQNVVENLTAFRQSLGDNEAAIATTAKRTGRPIWGLSLEDGLSESELSSLKAYKRQVNSFLLGTHLRGNHQAESILTLTKKTVVFIDLLPKGRFEALYEPQQFRERFLPNQLTLAFADYHSKLEENEYKHFRNLEYNEEHEVLSPKDFVNQYGPRPWDVINQVLTQFGTMPYRINSPEGLNRFDNFQAELVHQGMPNIKPNFGDLSSGEKILIALVVSVYKARSDRNFPRLLLLDEIDASLHPSMMESMLNIIQDAFIENDVNTVLITHSPTTIAICPESSIHVMYPAGAKRLERRTRGDALEILTEGFVTLTKGLSILDQAARTRVTVITEGKNTVFIQRALEIANIVGVHIVSGVEDRSGSTQLKTLFDFFAKLPHSNIIIVAWDCDAEKYRVLSEEDNTIPFVFQNNPGNEIAARGIENLFPVELVEGFKKEIHFADGRVKSEFDESQKAQFASFVLGRNTPSDFDKFIPLLNLIGKSLKRQGQ